MANSKDKFHLRRENRIYFLSEALDTIEYVCDITCKITVDKFRSCTSHNHKLSLFLCGTHHENWKYIALKPGDTLLSCFHMIVVQYHVLLKEMNNL